MGFKLTCLRCEKEIVIESGELDTSSFDDLEIYPVQGRVLIQCSCGNESDIE